jgi:hypothetical protein
LELRVCFCVVKHLLGLLLHPQRRSFDRPWGLALGEMVQPLPLSGVARLASL